MRLFGRGSSSGTGEMHEVPPVRHDSDGPPIEGYDGLKPEQVIASLRGYSQADLAVIETYEREHANRTVVLDKLRYLRTDEPVAGYDELAEGEIPGALAGADSETLFRVREYERKFKRRDFVLSHLADAGQNGDGQVERDASAEEGGA